MARKSVPAAEASRIRKNGSMPVITVERRKRKEHFAIVDRNHIHSGVFRANGPHRNKESLELKYEFPDGSRMTIAEFYPLTAFDAALLSVIVYRSATAGLPLHPDPSGEKGRELRKDLGLEGGVEHEDALVHTTTAKSLIRDMGLKWGSTVKKELEESIWRLNATNIRLERKGGDHPRQDSFTILSHIKSDDNKIVLAINPVLANTIFKPGFYARICIDDFAFFATNEKLMYIQLCNAIDPGKSRTFKPEELRVMMYGEDKDISPQTAAKQRFRRKASRGRSPRNCKAGI